MPKSVETLISEISDTTVARLILREFEATETAYAIGSWKEVGLRAGHFVEAVRRLIELNVFGNYTPIDKRLPTLTMKYLEKLESAAADDSLRLHLPRVLNSLYSLRNKRGIGHLSEFTAGKLDAEFTVAAVRWAMAELLRLSNGDPVDLDKAALKLSQYPVPAVWESAAGPRILSSKLRAGSKVLILLFLGGLTNIREISLAVKTSQGNMQKVVKRLQDKVAVEFNETTGEISSARLADVKRVSSSKN